MNKGSLAIFEIGDCITAEHCFSNYKVIPQPKNDGGIEISFKPEIEGNTVSFGKWIKKGKTVYEGYVCYGSSLAINRDAKRDGRMLPRIDLDKMIPLQAVFGLRIGDNCRENEILIAIDVIDVSDPDHRIELSMRNLTRADFQCTNKLQLFRLDFTPLSSDTILEFRILYCGKEYQRYEDIQKYKDKVDVIYADKIVVVDPAKVELFIPDYSPEPYEPSRSAIIDEFDASTKALYTATSPQKNACLYFVRRKFYRPNMHLMVMFGIFKSNYWEDKEKPILRLAVVKIKPEQTLPEQILSAQTLKEKFIYHKDFTIEDNGHKYFTLDFITPSIDTEVEFRIDYKEEIWNPKTPEPYYISAGKILVTDPSIPTVCSPRPTTRRLPWWAALLRWLLG